jgi:pimeloyl-ACP methyl ester carboxylesterase
MNRVMVYLLTMWIVAGSVSCAKIWLPDERSGLGSIDSRMQLIPSDNRAKPIGKMLEKTISVPLDPTNRWSQHFVDLYYFVRMPKTGKATKTVLFCAGGPGIFIPGPTLGISLADFLTDNGYNVVYFHPRGAGFSQIPSKNTYDKFLKTSFVVDDIEAIRKDFLGENGKWNAVIGYSFGTVMAQQYVGRYQAKTERLILLGTLSRHSLQAVPGPFDQIEEKIRETNRMTLEKIFQRPEFGVFDPSAIIDTALGTTGTQGIFQKVEEKFGSLAFVFNAYCELKARNELAPNGLDYSRPFFRALRGLRDFGWFPPLKEQLDNGKAIRDELSTGVPGGTNCDPELTGSSDRVFNVVSFYDGISIRFLEHWLTNGKTHVRDAVRHSGGAIHYIKGGINPQVDKVGINDSEAIEPWDPAKYQYAEATLILKGTADTRGHRWGRRCSRTYFSQRSYRPSNSHHLSWRRS